MFRSLSRLSLSTVALAGLVGVFTSSSAPVAVPGGFIKYTLNTSSSETGQARATVRGSRLTIEVTGATPNAMYTVWVDFRNRFTGMVTPDYPVGGLARGVAPAIATTQGVTSGMGLDANAFVTDGSGDAKFTVALDYSLLDVGSSPVVFEGLGMQGPNRVGGQWMRVYAGAAGGGAELQVTDPATGLPLVERATAQGITIVRHPDRVSHGMTPGVGGVDHNSAFSGDFPRGFRRR